ncbi:MAG: hypothetical protein IIU96_02930 [Paludibacteraceae bacterium]|nr:hypothetical protein [Paludibacteraceae bacterium]
MDTKRFMNDMSDDSKFELYQIVANLYNKSISDFNDDCDSTAHVTDEGILIYSINHPSIFKHLALVVDLCRAFSLDCYVNTKYDVLHIYLV